MYAFCEDKTDLLAAYVCFATERKVKKDGLYSFS